MRRKLVSTFPVFFFQSELSPFILVSCSLHKTKRFSRWIIDDLYPCSENWQHLASCVSYDFSTNGSKQAMENFFEVVYSVWEYPFYNMFLVEFSKVLAIGKCELSCTCLSFLQSSSCPWLLIRKLQSIVYFSFFCALNLLRNYSSLFMWEISLVICALVLTTYQSMSWCQDDGSTVSLSC